MYFGEGKWRSHRREAEWNEETVVLNETNWERSVQLKTAFSIGGLSRQRKVTSLFGVRQKVSLQGGVAGRQECENGAANAWNELGYGYLKLLGY